MSKFNKQIVRNSIFSVIQILVVTGATFFLYKYIIQIIGLEKLGLWSLILSVTSLANIGNFGFTGSLLKFSAELSAKNEYEKINAILNSSIIGVSAISSILLCSIYFLGYYSIGSFVDEKWIDISRSLLGYSLISLYLNIIAGLYFSILEGLNMAYLKSLAFILSTLFYVCLSIILINKYDLIGLAYAQIMQACIFLCFGVLLAFFKIKNFKFFYWKWYRKLMKKVFRYSVSFQMMGIAQMLYDPITKAILSKFGGLDFVAVFEMTTKIVKQVRSITVAILQNVIPKIVKLHVTQGKEKMSKLYERIVGIKTILIFLSLVLVIPFSGILSNILLGYQDRNFIIVLIALSIGWIMNSFNIAPYMINLGTGNLKWNVISHFTVGILNFLLCGFIGYFFENGFYIILSWIGSLIIGSLIIVFEYHKRNPIPLRNVFNKMFYQLLGCYIGLCIISYFINFYLENFLLLVILQSFFTLLYFSLILLKLQKVRSFIYYLINTKK